MQIVYFIIANSFFFLCTSSSYFFFFYSDTLCLNSTDMLQGLIAFHIWGLGVSEFEWSSKHSNCQNGYQARGRSMQSLWRADLCWWDLLLCFEFHTLHAQKLWQGREITPWVPELREAGLLWSSVLSSVEAGIRFSPSLGTYKTGFSGV